MGWGGDERTGERRGLPGYGGEEGAFTSQELGFASRETVTCNSRSTNPKLL